MKPKYYKVSYWSATGVRYRANYGQPLWDYYNDTAGKISKYADASVKSDHHSPTTWMAKKASIACKEHYMSYEGHSSYEMWWDRYSTTPKYPWMFSTPWMNYWDGSDARSPSPRIDSLGLNEANDKMYGRISETQYGYGQELAELVETSNYITGKALGLGRVLRDIRKGRFSSFIRKTVNTPTRKVSARARALAIARDRARKKRAQSGNTTKSTWRKLSVDDRWLETQFAVAPLISSVYDAVELYQNGIAYSTPIVTYAGTCKAFHPFEKYLTGGTNGETTTRSGGTSTVHRVKSAFRLDDPGLIALKELGLSNPLEWAWAVVPFSFVADWVLPIGKALSLMTALIGQTFMWCYESISIRASLSLNHVLAYSTRRTTNSEYYTVISYSRRTRQSLPIWVPRVKSPFSWWHGVTAGALLTSINK